MLQHGIPVRELRTAEANPFPSEMICALRREVVNEVGPFQETLVMAEDKPLLEIRVQVHLDPVQFVGPCELLCFLYSHNRYFLQEFNLCFKNI